MKKYLIVEEDTLHVFEVYSEHDSKEEAESVIEDGEKIVEVEILEQSAEYREEDVNWSDVTVKGLINNVAHEAVFSVQLVGTNYESQNGCWITTSDGDFCFSNEERMLFEVADVINHAEQAAKRVDEARYEYIDAGFNCSINNQSLSIRIDKEDGSAALIVTDDAHNPVCDYGAAFEVRQEFTDEEAAREFLNKFRTEDFQDCRGLYAYLKYDPYLNDE